MEIIGSIVLAFSIGLANTCGIGGGILNMEILVIFFALDYKLAVPVSSFCILAGAIVRIFLDLSNGQLKKHVQFDLLSLILPAIFMGTTTGVILN